MNNSITVRHSMTHYVHHTPGRLRVRTPILKHNQQQALQLRDLLEGLEGILAHEVKTATGSIVIRYNPAEIEAQAILSFLHHQGFISGTVAPERSKDRLSAFGTSLGAAMGKALFGLVLEKMVERTAMALVKAIV